MSVQIHNGRLLESLPFLTSRWQTGFTKAECIFHCRICDAKYGTLRTQALRDSFVVLLRVHELSHKVFDKALPPVPARLLDTAHSMP